MVTHAEKSAPTKRRRVLWSPKDDNEDITKAIDVSTSFPVLSPCSYGGEWHRRRQETPVHVDVTALASTGDTLVACTSLGDVVMWQAKKCSISGSTTSVVHNPSSYFEESPLFRCNVSRRPLKTIQCCNVRENGDCTILVGGEEGLWTISISGCTDKGIEKWENISEEVSEVLVMCGRVVLLEATGQVQIYNFSDRKLLYSIDLNGQASTVSLVKSLDENMEVPCSEDKYALLIGTTDSKIHIWNETSGSIVESIHCHTPDALHKVGTGHTLPFDIVVTSIHISQDQWWTIAGVCKAKRSSNRSILATLHGPTRTMVSYKETRETVNGIESLSSGLYTIANEGVVSKWDSPFHLERVQRIWTTPPSGRAVVHVGGSKLAVAGIGSKIDIFDPDCRILSLCVGGTTRV